MEKMTHNIHVVFCLLFIYIFEAWKMEGKFKIRNSNSNWVWNFDWIWLNLKLSLLFVFNIFFEVLIDSAKNDYKSSNHVQLHDLGHFLDKIITLLNLDLVLLLEWSIVPLTTPLSKVYRKVQKLFWGGSFEIWHQTYISLWTFPRGYAFLSSRNVIKSENTFLYSTQYHILKYIIIVGRYCCWNFQEFR